MDLDRDNQQTLPTASFLENAVTSPQHGASPVSSPIIARFFSHTPQIHLYFNTRPILEFLDQLWRVFLLTLPSTGFFLTDISTETLTLLSA
jgi:hypothetical protein